MPKIKYPQIFDGSDTFVGECLKRWGARLD
jgi:hypothetical protein